MGRHLLTQPTAAQRRQLAATRSLTGYIQLPDVRRNNTVWELSLPPFCQPTPFGRVWRGTAVEDEQCPPPTQGRVAVIPLFNRLYARKTYLFRNL